MGSNSTRHCSPSLDPTSNSQLITGGVLVAKQPPCLRRHFREEPQSYEQCIPGFCDVEARPGLTKWRQPTPVCPILNVPSAIPGVAKFRIHRQGVPLDHGQKALLQLVIDGFQRHSEFATDELFRLPEDQAQSAVDGVEVDLFRGKPLRALLCGNGNTVRQTCPVEDHTGPSSDDGQPGIDLRECPKGNTTPKGRPA